MAKLDKKTRDSLKDSDFGIPSKRMYPIHDKEHVEAAVKLFGHASNEDKPELAHNILRKAKEFGMDSSGWTQINEWAKKYKGKNTNESADEVNDEKIVNSVSNDEDDYEDLTEGITEGFFDRFKKNPTTELSDDEYFDKIRTKTTLATNLFDEFKRTYSSERYQNLLELSKTNKISFSSPTGNTFNIELLTAKEINECCWDDSEMEEMYGFQFAAGLGSADDITFGIGIKDGSILMNGEKVADNISDFLKKLNKSENVNEAAVGASLLTVKNQLMKMVGDAFKFIGGSLVPKFTMQSTEKPQVSFDVNAVGQNVEVTPKYNGAPDTMHKRKGIAFMRAADTIANFVQDVVNNFTAKPAAAAESFYITIGEDRLYDMEDFMAYFEGTEYMEPERNIYISESEYNESCPFTLLLENHEYNRATNSININGTIKDIGIFGNENVQRVLNKFMKYNNDLDLFNEK